MGGYRTFTLEQALAHWSDPDYEDPQRGESIVQSINKFNSIKRRWKRKMKAP